MSPLATALTSKDYENLLAFRVALRRFQHWSQTKAREAGLTPAQHQLLLAIKGHPGPLAPAIGDLAHYLLLRHHSTVELVDRAEAAGLVRRWGDHADGRVTRIRLTPEGERRLAQLSQAHLEELRSLAPVVAQLMAGLGPAEAGPAQALLAQVGLAEAGSADQPAAGPGSPAGAPQ
jgi:DNA-binding MarR family transcriptional regulator